MFADELQMREQQIMRFKSSIALVTGAGSGIGRATTLQLAREGARVAVVDIDREAGQQTLELLHKEGGEGVFLLADVAQSADVQGAINRVMELWGRLDILVNNAGTMRFAPVVQLSEDDWDRVINVNLRSAFLFCKYAVPHMRRASGRRGGSVVNVSSVHASATTRNVAAYAASKGGLEAFTRALALEVETQSVRVNAVAPGAVDTPLLWSNPNLQSGAEKLEGTVISAQGIADAICYLASEQAAFITGTVLNVDAGRLARL
ncbi:cyclopentanol dehydrogenase [Abditibacteriota bacterium]|nr:cyclopentanol dehydrogenase [Abditibacteriota bacterium]